MMEILASAGLAFGLLWIGLIVRDAYVQRQHSRKRAQQAHRRLMAARRRLGLDQ